MTPSSLNVRGGASVPITAYALRKDGFTNEIALALKDAPAGYRLTGAVIPANQDQVRFTLTAPLSAARDPVTMSMEGRANMQGHPVVRPAVPSDDMMQAFAYRHLVPAQELKVALTGRLRPRSEMAVLSPKSVRLSAGGTARLELDLPVGGFVHDIAYELVDPPDGISVKEMTPDGLVLQADAAKVKVGQKGNLIIAASGTPAQAADAKRPANMNFRFPLGAFPALAYEITP